MPFQALGIAKTPDNEHYHRYCHYVNVREKNRAGYQLPLSGIDIFYLFLYTLLPGAFPLLASSASGFCSTAGEEGLFRD